jgi:CRISPR-associated protein Cst2
MNLFGTVLTYTAPSANYRGESAENRAVIQKITRGRFEYAIISPEAMRNALRETLRALGLLCNRERLHDEEQLAVKFQDYPDADKYADDFFMGWLIAATGKDREKIRKELKEKKRNVDAFTFKRDSVLRMNMAVALEPYRHDSVFTQSPLNVDSPWKNAESSQLLHRETAVTAYQYPFALNLEDCRGKVDWTRALLKAIGQLNDVAGNHARSYFEFAPASIVLRLTPQLVAGFDTYGFRIADSGRHELPEIVDGILTGDYLANELYIGGKVVKDMEDMTCGTEAAGAAAGNKGKGTQTLKDALTSKGAILDRSPQRLLERVGADAFAQA